MLNPESIGTSIVELCKTAGVSRDIYYDAIKKPEFMKLYQETVISVIKNESYPLIKAGLREAKRGSFQHWKVLLEMAGLYTEKQIVDVGDNVVTLSREERQSRILELIGKKPTIEAVPTTTYSILPEKADDPEKA
jgi:hypothetical protein